MKDITGPELYISRKLKLINLTKNIEQLYKRLSIHFDYHDIRKDNPGGDPEIASEYAFMMGWAKEILDNLQIKEDKINEQLKLLHKQLSTYSAIINHCKEFKVPPNPTAVESFVRVNEQIDKIEEIF